MTPVVTVDEAKAALRLSTNNTVHDVQLATLILSATSKLTNETELVGINTGLTYHRDLWAASFLIPYRPVLTVDQVRYLDADGSNTVVDSGDYWFSVGRRQVSFNSSFEYPALFDRRDVITVTYSAGFGTTADKVPYLFKQAVLLQVGYWFGDPQQENAESYSSQRAYWDLVDQLRRTSYP